MFGRNIQTRGVSIHLKEVHKASKQAVFQINMHIQISCIIHDARFGFKIKNHMQSIGIF